MRAGPLSDSRVIERLNRYFVPVYVVNEDHRENGPASPQEKAERRRIFLEGHAAGLSVGTVHVYILGPDGRLRDSRHVGDAAKTENLLALLDRTISELDLTPGEPAMPPAPQSGPPAESEELTLHVVARSLDGRGAWSEFPVENWITLSNEEAARLVSLPPFELEKSRRIDQGLAKKILTHFYPATENNDVTKNQFEYVQLDGTIAEAGPDKLLVRLEGRFKMQHAFYHKPDDRMVEATVLGYAEMDPNNRQVRSLRMVTTKATYGGGQFAVGLRSVP